MEGYDEVRKILPKELKNSLTNHYYSRLTHTHSQLPTHYSGIDS